MNLLIMGGYPKPLPTKVQGTPTLMVEAGAGSGKTESLARRVVALLRTGRAEPRGIAAITFTRNAAAELRQRVQVRLEAATRAAAAGAETERLVRANEHLGEVFVGTIHSFCARLLREHPFEAGLDPEFRELEAAEADAFLLEAWERWLGRIRVDHPGVLDELVQLGVRHDELTAAFQMLSAQRDVAAVWRAVPAPDSATAAQRLAEFLRAMRIRLPAQRPTGGWDKLQAAVLRCQRLLQLAATDGGLPYLWRAHEALDHPLKVVQARWASKAEGKDARDHFSRFRAEVVTPALKQWSEHLHGRIVPLLLPAVEFASAERRGAGRLDYTDLLLGAARLLREHPDVRRQLTTRYSHLLVDEFQDTDPVQAEVMLLLTSDDLTSADWRQLRPRAGSLFVVGDPKQSIYRFRRADIATYQQVKARIRAAGGEVLRLTASFRSPQPVTDWVNETLGRLLPATETPYQAAMARLDPIWPDPGAPLCGVRRLTVPPEETTNDDVVEADARRIAAFIAHACRGGLSIPEDGQFRPARPDDFLVLTHRRRHTLPYISELVRLGVPAETVGLDPETDTLALRAWLGVLHALADPEDPVRLVGCLRGPCFGCSDDELHAYRRAGGGWSLLRPERPAGPVGEAVARLAEYWRLTRRLPTVAAVLAILEDLALLPLVAGSPGRSGEARALAAAVDAVATADEALGLPAAVALLDALVEDPDLGAGSTVPGKAVRVMNLHQVKGLEASVVFLAAPVTIQEHRPTLHVDRRGPEPRLHLLVAEHDPYGRIRRVLAQPPEWEAAEAEERLYGAAEDVRLLYVACTRAKHLLVVSRRGAGPDGGAWAALEPGLEDIAELDIPVVAAPDHRVLPADAVGPVLADLDRTAAAMERARGEAYRAVAATSLVHGDLPEAGAPGRGRAWGTAAHRLLRALGEGAQQADWRPLAVAVLAEEGLDPGLADEMVALAAGVWESGFGARLRQASSVLCEVPFALPLPSRDLGLEHAPESAVLHGVIDVAFREPRGWVIADYKTDDAADRRVGDLVHHYGPQVRAYAEAWPRLQGEPVSEALLVFTSPVRMVSVGPLPDRVGDDRRR